MKYRVAVAVILSLFINKASATGYSDFTVGTLKGKLTVQWLESDLFLFIPDSTDPLFFRRANGQLIKPGRMLTDGGTIPRPMRVFRNYSPWGYAPAFIVHDWLFTIKHCRMENYLDFTLVEAGKVMAEIIKTMMEQGKFEKDEFTVWVMYEAVTSRFAKKYWDNDRCLPVPNAFDRAPIYQFTIEFP